VAVIQSLGFSTGKGIPANIAQTRFHHLTEEEEGEKVRKGGEKEGKTTSVLGRLSPESLCLLFTTPQPEDHVQPTSNSTGEAENQPSLDFLSIIFYFCRYVIFPYKVT